MFRLVTFIAFLTVAATVPKYQHCRCRPHDSCWPSPQKWQALNDSIQGNLVALKPVAFVCHDPTFNAADCQATTAMTHNSSWRSMQPGVRTSYPVLGG